MVHHVSGNNEQQLLEVFDALQEGAQGTSAITIRILPAADTDGVCATRIFATMLQKVKIKYTVVPVTSNTEITDQFQQVAEDADLRSIVLLNCGASINLQHEMIQAGTPDDVRCYVIDSHRPFMLSNLSSDNQRVVVIDDDPIADAAGIQPPINEDAGSDKGDDNDSVASDGAHSDAGDSDDEKEDVWDAGERPPEQSRSRKRRGLVDRLMRQQRKRQRLNEYYSTSYYATPCAMSLFKMAKQQAPPSQDLLWLAAVSLTGYHDLGMLSELQYNQLAEEELREALDRSCDIGSFATQSSTSRLPDASSFASDDESVIAGSRRHAPLSSHGKRRLRFEKDLRLTLYKHWTLEESIMHSSYFYGSLELYRDKGLRSLKNFFATAGIVPANYKQLYSCMQFPIKKSMQQKFKDHGKAYGLTEKMFLQQFVRDLGGQPGDAGQSLFLQEVSCLDAAHIVTALLSGVPAALGSAQMAALPQTADGRRDTVAISELERDSLVDNFWRAYEAVLCKEPTPLVEGIAEAVEVAKAVNNLARLVKDTRAIHTAKHFRWCKIEQPPHPFRHHITIRRFAVWLLHVHFTFRPKSDAKELPLLVIVRDQVRNVYMCVGATPTRVSEQDEFGTRFRQALRQDKTLKFRYDFFDKSCIEIFAEDFDRFWDIMKGPSGG